MTILVVAYNYEAFKEYERGQQSLEENEGVKYKYLANIEDCSGYHLDYKTKLVELSGWKLHKTYDFITRIVMLQFLKEQQKP